MMDNPPLAPIRRYDLGLGCRCLGTAADQFCYPCELEKQHCKQRFYTAHHGQPHPDIADHRRLRLVIAEAVHPGESGTQ